MRNARSIGTTLGMRRYYSRIPKCKVCKKARLNRVETSQRGFCTKCWRKCISIEDGEWYYYGCFIQRSEHPALFGRYEVWKDDQDKSHIGRYETFKEAKQACRENSVEDPERGPHHFI